MSIPKGTGTTDPGAADRRWYGQPAAPAPAGRSFLVVDDNDRYARALESDLRARGVHTLRAASAAEGIRLFEARADQLDGVVTDISMESELAGLRLVRHVRRRAFPGSLAVASTAFDRRIGFAVNRLVLGHLLPCDYLIPKRPIARGGTVLWLPTPACDRYRRVIAPGPSGT